MPAVQKGQGVDRWGFRPKGQHALALHGDYGAFQALKLQAWQAHKSRREPNAAGGSAESVAQHGRHIIGARISLLWQVKLQKACMAAVAAASSESKVASCRCTWPPSLPCTPC